MKILKQLLIDHLQRQGIDPDHVSSFLKALRSLIQTNPGIEPAIVNQKLCQLGWDEVSIDYHFLQMALACLEDDFKNNEAPNAEQNINSSF